MDHDRAAPPKHAWKNARTIAHSVSYQGFLANAKNSSLLLGSSYFLYMAINQSSTVAALGFAAVNALNIYASRHHVTSIRTAFNRAMLDHVTSTAEKTRLAPLDTAINAPHPIQKILPLTAGVIGGGALLSPAFGLAVATAIIAVREQIHVARLRRACVPLLD